MEKAQYIFGSAIQSINRIMVYTEAETFETAEMEDLEVRLEALKEAWALVKEKEKDMVCTEDQVQVETQRRKAEAEECYFSAHAALRRRMLQLTPAAREKDGPPIAVQVNMPFQQHDVQNTWGDFDGSITRWQGFRDRFVAAIHQNDRISPAYKFAYLKNSLTGKAARTLGEWQLTDSNYCEAWKRLNEVYERTYATCRELLRHFFRLPMLQGVPKAAELQRMANTTHETLRQLAAQGVPTEQWDMIIVHVLHEKLDHETACKWEESRTSERPSAKEFCTFLDKRAAALESVMDNRRREMPTTSSHARMNTGRGDGNLAASRNQPRAAEKEGNKRRMPCHMCKSIEHPIWSCSKFSALGLKARQEAVRERNLCPNCLKTDHVVKDCFQGSCIRCPGKPKHNSMLCPMKELRKVEATAYTVQEKPKKCRGKHSCNDSKCKRD